MIDPYYDVTPSRGRKIATNTYKNRQKPTKREARKSSVPDSLPDLIKSGRVTGICGQKRAIIPEGLPDSIKSGRVTGIRAPR